MGLPVVRKGLASPPTICLKQVTKLCGYSLCVLKSFSRKSLMSPVGRFLLSRIGESTTSLTVAGHVMRYRRVGDNDKDDAPMPLNPVALDVIIMTSHGRTVRRVILVVMMWSQCCERGLEYPGLRRMVLLSCR